MEITVQNQNFAFFSRLESIGNCVYHLLPCILFNVDYVIVD
jgi:hypothetical protein